MQQTLYLMLGYPGAGKTTVAQFVSEITGAVHIWADHERKIRYGEPCYSKSENKELYDALNEKVTDLLDAGKSVVYDTAFNHYEDRKKLRLIADNRSVQTILLWVRAPRDIAKDRAVDSKENQPTRVLNDKNPMQHEHFEYLSDKLEDPHSNERLIKIDGTKVSKNIISDLLN